MMERNHNAGFKYPTYMCVAEFDAEAHKIAVTCAPDSLIARDMAHDLMIRCLRRNGFGVGVDRIMALTGEQETEQSKAAETAQAVAAAYSKATSTNERDET